MRKFTWTVVLLLTLTIQGFSQLTFTAVNNGNWNGSNVWSTDGVTPIPCGPCVAGTHFPGALDDAFTNGRTITITAGATVKNIAVSYNTAAALVGPAALIVTGTMAGWDDASGLPTAPIVNVFNASAPLIRFTAANYDGINPFFVLVSGEILSFWNSTSPFGTVLIQLAQNAVLDGGDPLFGGPGELQFGSLTITGGTALNPLELQTGFNVTAIRPTSLTIGTNTTLITEVPLSNATGTITSSRMTSASIQGRLWTSSYFNTITVSVGASGRLESSFNGPNQTQGWWYTSNAPGTVTLAAGSTVIFDYEGNQNIPTRVYSNLILDGSGTKTLNGATAFTVTNLSVLTDVTLFSLPATARNISGNLVVDGSWQPSLTVFFNGTAGTQSVSGTGVLNFNGSINKSGAGTLLLNKTLSISNGITVAGGTLDLGNFTTTLATGNFSMTGNVTSGTSGTLAVSSSSMFSGAGSFQLNNLTVNGTATINNSNMSLTGNITNNGTITLNSTSNVTFTGGSQQIISGNAFTVGNMTINKASQTLFNNGNVELLGTLTVTTGTFDADGQTGTGIYTLNSDTNGDARIGPMAGGSIVGQVTFERYFNNTTVNLWRNLAFPVTGVTYAQLGASITLGTNSVAYYTESVLGNVDQGWTYISSGTLSSARGHSVRMQSVAPINISIRGPLLQQVPALGVSPYNFNVTFTDDPAQPLNQDGWNYTPNPFASAINWNNAGWVKTRVDAAAAVWDVQNFTYRYSNVDWDGIVAQGQAFWVHTNAASPVLTCTESVKDATNDPVFYRKASEESRMLISLKSSMYTDKAALQFRDDASVEFDGDFDSYKLPNQIFNLSTLSPDGADLAANTLPRTPCTSDVRLNITNIEPGTYSLKFEGLGSFNDLESVVLVDNFTNTTVTLSGSASHAFEVTTDAGSYGSSRFELKFKFSEAQPVPAIEAAQDVLVSKFEEGDTYQWFLNGARIEGATESSYRPILNGSYSYEVSYKGCALVSETIQVEAKKRVFPNPVSEDLKVQVDRLISTGVGSGEIVISSSLGEIVKKVSFNSSDLVKSIDMRDVKPGQYMVSISANSKIIERVKIVVQ